MRHLEKIRMFRTRKLRSDKLFQSSPKFCADLQLKKAAVEYQYKCAALVSSGRGRKPANSYLKDIYRGRQRPIFNQYFSTEGQGLSSYDSIAQDEGFLLPKVIKLTQFPPLLQ